MKITKIYSLFTDEDFPKVPTDGSALIRFFEDLYVYHEGYWMMVKYDPFADINVLDLTKPIPYIDDGQVYTVSKAKWEYLK